MGYDVYMLLLFGNAPKNEQGEYFRANIWWWPPLWDYCIEVAPEIAKNVECAYSNDGDGLDAHDAEELANALDLSLLTGTAMEKEEAYRSALAEYPMKPCPMKPEEGKHNKCMLCDGKGEIRDVPFEASVTLKPFAVDLVKEFMTFCRYSGGFKIH